MDFLLFLQYYGVFLFFEYCSSSGGIFFVFVLFVGGVLCVFIHLLHSSLGLFILGVLGPWGFLWRAGSSFLLRGAPLCGVSVRYYLSASLEWVAGLYSFSSFGLRCGGYGTIEIVEGCGPFSLPSSVFCLFCWQVVVCGRAPFFS